MSYLTPPGAHNPRFHILILSSEVLHDFISRRSYYLWGLVVTGLVSMGSCRYRLALKLEQLAGFFDFCL